MLDPDNPVPLYQQLINELRSAIESGVWAPHQAIPPERELTQRYGVSRITVRQALSELVSQGLLYRQHGRGTFVAPRLAPFAESLSTLMGHLEELQTLGLEPQVQVLTLKKQLMPSDVCKALRREEGAEGWYVYRLVAVDNLPLMINEVYLPMDLEVPLDSRTLQHTGVNRVLEERGHNLVRGIQRIGAQRASSEVARRLRVESGEALLRVERVVFGRGDLPLVWVRTLYRSDRYQYEVELKRRR